MWHSDSCLQYGSFRCNDSIFSRFCDNFEIDGHCNHNWCAAIVIYIKKKKTVFLSVRSTYNQLFTYCLCIFKLTTVIAPVHSALYRYTVIIIEIFNIGCFMVLWWQTSSMLRVSYFYTSVSKLILSYPFAMTSSHMCLYFTFNQFFISFFSHFVQSFVKFEKIQFIQT